MATSPAAIELSEDALLGGRLRLLQPRRGYRVAIDPVLLAAAVDAGAGEAVLDAGAGTGAAALCLSHRVPGCRITGLEREPELLGIAERNVRANGMAERVRLVAGDLLAPSPEIRDQAFDRVMTNPPFHPARSSTPPRTATGRAAHLAETEPQAWIAACLARLRPLGWLTLIHRADRLDALLAALAGRAGDIVVCPLWPSAGAELPKRVLVKARKAARGPLRLVRGLTLHEADGRFTPEAEAILRDAAPLALRPSPATLASCDR
jgi:tRNA1(Val) A37 N6-methylase TrmN6